MKLYKSTRTGRYFVVSEDTKLSDPVVYGVCLLTFSYNNITGAAQNGQLVLIGNNWKVMP